MISRHDCYMLYIYNYNDTILTAIYTNLGLKRENMGGKVKSHYSSGEIGAYSKDACCGPKY